MWKVKVYEIYTQGLPQKMLLLKKNNKTFKDKWSLMS